MSHHVSRKIMPALALLATLTLVGCATPPASGGGDAAFADQVKMTWFGITNWHYQIGDLGILLDGAISSFNEPGAVSDPALVRRVHDVIRATGGSVDVMLVGHYHGDHSFDSPAWAMQTGARYYGSEEACADAVENGVPRGQCVPVVGGETIALNDQVTMRVVRWSHSVGCGVTSEGGTAGIETFGYFLTVDTPRKTLSWLVTDRGAGGVELVTDRIVDGTNHGAPLHNLLAAVRDAGLTGFEIWQGAPEFRSVAQARFLIPIFDVKHYMAQHYGARGGFDFLGGLHYAYDRAEVPKLDAFLASQGVPHLFATNYFDAWVYDAAGLRPVQNTAAKAALGFPASGPGPNPQGPNPRAGALECPED